MHYFFFWSFSLEEKSEISIWKSSNWETSTLEVDALKQHLTFPYLHLDIFVGTGTLWTKREEQFQSVLFLIFHLEFFWRKKINRSFVIRRRKSKKEKKITHKGHKKFLLVCYANALIIFETKSDFRMLKRLWLNCTCFMLWIINKNQF